MKTESPTQISLFYEPDQYQSRPNHQAAIRKAEREAEREARRNPPDIDDMLAAGDYASFWTIENTIPRKQTWVTAQCRIHYAHSWVPNELLREPVETVVRYVFKTHQEWRKKQNQNESTR